MPVTIKCSVAPLFAKLPVPQPLSLGGVPPEQYFAVGSANDINLQLTYESDPVSQVPAFATTMFDLHNALQAVTKNPVAPGLVTKIAVLMADSFKGHPGTLGVMFDRGFRFDKNTFGQVPREGCAVFLRPIAKARSTLKEYKQEVAFTAIHELGHIFNLLHASNPVNLMTQSGQTLHPPPYFFIDKHRFMLNHCSKSKYIHPGGSDFGDRGTLGVDPSPDPTNSLPDFGLKLSLEFARSEFWCFEPVEVDVTIAVRRGVDRDFFIPDAVDPGYFTFTIWIEDPDGERRRYRSPKQFCGTSEKLAITPAKPFRRDISIFGESGGYTFRKAGVHRVWAVMDIGGFSVASEQVPVNVLPDEESLRYEQYRQAFSRKATAQLMYYRRGAPKVLGAMSEFAQEHKGEVVAAETHYAIARALIARAAVRRSQFPKEDEKPATIAQRVKRLRAEAVLDEAPMPADAREHLKRAYDHPLLSRHRREIIEACLAPA